jgi:hypothetical protein
MSEDKKGEDLTICGGDDFLVDQGIADPAEFRVKSHLFPRDRHHRRAARPDPGRRGSARRRTGAGSRSDHEPPARRLRGVAADQGIDVVIPILPDGGRERGVVLPETVMQGKEQVACSTTA